MAGIARIPRAEMGGVPLHMVQRGKNRLPCLPLDDDRHRDR